MADNFGPEIHFALQLEDGRFFQGSVKRLCGERLSTNWIVHPEADCAVAEIKSIPSDYMGIIRTHSKPARSFESRLEAPKMFTELAIIGLPYNTSRIKDGRMVIGKTGRVASGLLKFKQKEKDEGPLESEVFLLDNPSLPGFSGSPVVSLPRDTEADSKCYGLASGHISKESGFTFVTPSAYIVELLI